MTSAQYSHFANVRDVLHIHGFDVPWTTPDNLSLIHI
jgi:hypothetical protein